MLPDIDGKEVARKMLEINNDARIVVLSGLGSSPQAIFENLKIGVVSVLQKPVEQTALYEAIKKASDKKLAKDE